MAQNNYLDSLSKEKLIELIGRLAMDGVWFQSIERKYGMDEAILPLN